MYRGATPHLRNIHKIKTNQAIPKEATSFKEEVFAKYKKTCSSRYQSKLKSLK